MTGRITRVAAALLVCVLLSACRGGQSFKDDIGIQRLASCSIEDSPFQVGEEEAEAEGTEDEGPESTDFTDDEDSDEEAVSDVERWKNTYHATVDQIVEADLDSLAQSECVETPGGLPPATPALRALASTLPPWKNAPTELNNLSQADMGAVLLEYLRTYQCAMAEYQQQFYTYAAKEGMTVVQYDQLEQETRTLIRDELVVSRLALERTLSVTGRLGRLRPLFHELDCVIAASLDLRNQLGLISEVSSCLPRVRDARNTLRDLQDDE